jgi:lysophospholipase L1-like esterase
MNDIIVTERFIEAKDFDEYNIIIDSPLPMVKGTRGWRGPRFGPEEIDFLDSINPTGSLSLRARCSTGVWIRFSTNSKVRLKGHFLGFARPKRAFDLRVDGEYVELQEPITQEEFNISLGTCGEFHTYELLMPHVAEAEIQGIEVTPGATFRSVEPIKRLIWIACGDSITQGMNADRPKDIYVQIVADKLGLLSRNYGVGGARIWPELWKNGINGDAHLISILVGVNDHNSGDNIDEFKEKYSLFLSLALYRHPKVPIICITPIWRKGEDDLDIKGFFLEDYREVIRGLVKDIANPMVQIVEGKELLPEDPELLSDGVHPNNQGFRVMADNLEPYLQKAIKGINL